MGSYVDAYGLIHGHLWVVNYDIYGSTWTDLGHGSNYDIYGSKLTSIEA
ncbi:MAG: hypothetical protein OCD76_19500 [Reichenbachiella sp.]